MKYIKFILVILISSILASSCDDNALETTPLDFNTPDNTYKDVNGIEQGITGLYSDVRDYFYSNLEGDFEAMCLFGVGTDVAYDGESPDGNRLLTNYETSVTPESKFITNWWRIIYREIQQANTLIKAINDLDEGSLSNSKNNLLAEPKFFRAFAYRIAVTLWGDIPLVTEVIQGEKTNFIRSPKQEVYKQIEQDLIFATKNLPEPGSEPSPGKLTKGAAWQLLTKVYLAQEKFQLAEEAASKVIDDYNYKLMIDRFGSHRNIVGPGNVYSDLFNYNNQNTAENTETIWAIQFEPDVEGGGANAWPYNYGPRYFSWGKTPDGFPAFQTQYSDTLGRPVARVRGTNLVNYDIWKSDWDNDIRNSKVNIKRKFYFDSPKSKYDGQEIKTTLYKSGERTTWKDTINYIYPYFLKTFSPVYQAQTLGHNQAEGGGRNIYTDFYAMRLAETYLLRAEAYLGLNNKPQAAEDINAVRKRAHATPVASGDVDINFLLNERIRELYGEEMRLIVLMRMNKLVERTRKYNDNPFTPSANIQSHNKLFPIPQQQIDLNNKAEFKQNQGY